MRQTIQGVVFGALVAAGVSVLLAQTPTWTTPRTWALDDLLTAQQFNSQFRDNLLWLRQDAQLTGTAALLDLGCGTLGTNEVLFADCTWATIPDFDLHDTVTQSATIVDADRLAFSDEGTAGDPMRYSTAANLADYMQTEVELNANRVTAGTFGTARIPELPASNTTSGTFAPARLCTGTPTADTVCRGDGTWGTLPIGFDTADFSDFSGQIISQQNCPTTPGGTDTGGPSRSSRYSNLATVSVLSTTIKPRLQYDVTVRTTNPTTEALLTISSQTSEITAVAQVTYMSVGFVRMTGITSDLASGPWSFVVTVEQSGNAITFCPEISSIEMIA